MPEIIMQLHFLSFFTISYFIFTFLGTRNCSKSFLCSRFLRKSNDSGRFKRIEIERKCSKKKIFYAIRRYRKYPTWKKVESLPVIVYFPLSDLLSALTIFKFECTCLMDLSLEGKLNLCKEFSGLKIDLLFMHRGKKFDSRQPWSSTKLVLKEKDSRYGRKANQRGILKDSFFPYFMKPWNNETIFCALHDLIRASKLWQE